MAARTLNIKETQILKRFPTGPNYTWHHRVLLEKLADGRWLGSSPDQEIEVMDLSRGRFRML